MQQPLGNITQCHKQKVSANLRKQIISSIFSNHNAMRLEINYKKKEKKTAKHITHGGKQYATKQQMDQRRN